MVETASVTALPTTGTVGRWCAFRSIKCPGVENCKFGFCEIFLVAGRWIATNPDSDVEIERTEKGIYLTLTLRQFYRCR